MSGAERSVCTITESAVDRVVRQVREGIEAEVFVAGQRLTESSLSEQFMVSRPILREAFSRLQADGLVDIQRFKGVSIRSLSLSDANEILRICAVFEALTASDAARKIDRGDNRAYFLREVESFFSAKAQSAGEGWDIGRKLQNAIARVADNAHLQRIGLRVHNPLLRSFALREDRNLLSLNRTKALARPATDAILDGDSELAEIAMKNWLNAGRTLLITPRQ